MNENMKEIIWVAVNKIQEAALSNDPEGEAQKIKTSLFKVFDNATAYAIWKMSLEIAKAM